MSKRLDVLAAVKDLISTALPGAKVVGLDADADGDIRFDALGGAVVRAGDPGEAMIDLSPPRYNYDHQIPVELTAFQSGILTNEQALDAMMVRIGDAIEADRFLGGMVDWLDALAPVSEPLSAEGTAAARAADLIIVATYATDNPLT